MSTISSFNSTSNNYDLPRNISGGLKMRIMFGNTIMIMGILFFLFGSIFPFIIGTQIDFKSAFASNADNVTTQAVITSRTKTDTRVNKHRVYEYMYDFKTADGKTVSGTSFSSTSLHKEGDSVTIQYSQKGMSSSAIPIWVLPLTCIFPFIGLIFVIVSIRNGRKNIFLVQNGILTAGTVTKKERTNTRINNNYVYKVFFQFKSQDGSQQEAFVKTHKIDRILDEKEEKLVYDPNKPTEAMLIDALPKQVRKFFEGM
jgi:hypothetical protein